VFDTNVSHPSAELRRLLLPRRYAAGSVEVFELTPLPNAASSVG
jgi:hypothetical protein